MSIAIVKQGIMDTFQDNGRYGYQHLGITPGGSVDRFAAKVVNALVGNSPDEAVLELHFPAAQILFEYDALIAIGGADWNPMINDRPIPLWRPIFIRRNTLLQFPQIVNGMRCYLALAGGWNIEKWLGSYSTQPIAEKGGFKGRKLLTGDRIEFREYHLNWISRVHDDHIVVPLPWSANVGEIYANPNSLSYIRGHEWDLLTETSRYAFSTQPFIVTQAADRMGYHLQGPHLHLKMPFDDPLPSVVVSGTIQLQPTGQLTILSADHQTTGAFPKLGHIISAQLPKFAQLRPGQPIRFYPIEQEQAEEMLIESENLLDILTEASRENLKPYL